MKKIQLKKNTLFLPGCWEELNFRQKRFAFSILIRVLHGDLKANPDAGLIEFLVFLTGYRPKGGYVRRIKERILLFLRMTTVWLCNIPYCLKYGSKEFREFMELKRQIYLPSVREKENEKDLIHYNLLRIAKELDFLFEIDVENRKLIPLYSFKKNPFPFLKIKGKKIWGRCFEMDVTVRTDITAREFVDCLDLLSFIRSTEDSYMKEEFLNQLCGILYPAGGNYIENQVSGHHHLMKRLNPVIKFSVAYWFTGIVKFYTDHPVYGLLFRSSNQTPPQDHTDKVYLSSEILLMLQKEGYGGSETMNLNDYFDAQIKHLKDMISGALSSGLNTTQIAQKTGISLAIIMKLS